MTTRRPTRHPRPHHNRRRRDDGRTTTSTAPPTTATTIDGTNDHSRRRLRRRRHPTIAPMTGRRSSRSWLAAASPSTPRRIWPYRGVLRTRDRLRHRLETQLSDAIARGLHIEGQQPFDVIAIETGTRGEPSPRGARRQRHLRHRSRARPRSAGRRRRQRRRRIRAQHHGLAGSFTLASWESDPSLPWRVVQAETLSTAAMRRLVAAVATSLLTTALLTVLPRRPGQRPRVGPIPLPGDHCRADESPRRRLAHADRRWPTSSFVWMQLPFPLDPETQARTGLLHAHRCGTGADDHDVEFGNDYAVWLENAATGEHVTSPRSVCLFFPEDPNPTPPPPPPSPAEFVEAARTVLTVQTSLSPRTEIGGLTGLDTWLWCEDPGDLEVGVALRGWTATATMQAVQHAWAIGGTASAAFTFGVLRFGSVAGGVVDAGDEGAVLGDADVDVGRGLDTRLQRAPCWHVPSRPVRFRRPDGAVPGQRVPGPLDVTGR